MCTGDRASSAKSIGSKIGILNSEIRSEMMPQQKAEMVGNMVSLKRRVMMVGDGLNDAASLAAATIGVAIGSRSRLTVAAAQVILIRSDLRDLLSFFNLSKETVQIIQLNYIWAFGFNLLSLPIAAGVLYPTIIIPPAIAGILMAISSIMVVGNSLRLLRFKPNFNKFEQLSFDEDDPGNWDEFNAPLNSIGPLGHTEMIKYSKLSHE